MANEVTMPQTIAVSEELVNSTTTALLTVMGEEEALYDHLLQLAKRKRQAIAAADPLVLQGLVEEEEVLVGRAQVLEETRLRELEPWSTVTGLAVETMTISSVARAFPEPMQSDLLQAGDRLRARVDDAAHANGENAALLQGCIGLLADSIGQLLDTTIRDGQHYAQNGRRTDEKRESAPHLLDYQA